MSRPSSEQDNESTAGIGRQVDMTDSYGRAARPLVYVVDDEEPVRETLRTIFAASGFRVMCFSRPAALLADNLQAASCLVADVRMPEMNGLELQREIAQRGIDIPIIFVTGAGDVPLAVEAMQAGAFDFLQKPFDADGLLASVGAAIATRNQSQDRAREGTTARIFLERLTKRELAVFRKLVQGKMNKIAAFELGISPRTVEVHRAHIMRKLNARSVADLVRIAMAAPGSAAGDGE